MYQGHRLSRLNNNDRVRRIMLDKLIHLYERSRVAIEQISSLNKDSSLQDWEKALSVKNGKAINKAIEDFAKLPKPKDKKLRKLKQCYADLLSACMKAGGEYYKPLFDGNLERKRNTKIIFWTSYAKELLKTFLRDLQKIRDETKKDIEWFCDECKAILQEDDKFCPKCGVELE